MLSYIYQRNEGKGETAIKERKRIEEGERETERRMREKGRGREGERKGKRER